MQDPVVVIFLGNKKGITPYLIAETTTDTDWKIWRIRVYDERFKTKAGIGIGSTYGDIKKAYEGETLKETHHSEGDIYVYVPSLMLHFGLDVTPSASVHLKDAPDSTKVIDVVVFNDD